MVTGDTSARGDRYRVRVADYGGVVGLWRECHKTVTLATTPGVAKQRTMTEQGYRHGEHRADHVG
jgi:hypothetical protein